MLVKYLLQLAKAETVLGGSERLSKNSLCKSLKKFAY